MMRQMKCQFIPKTKKNEGGRGREGSLSLSLLLLSLLPPSLSLSLSLPLSFVSLSLSLSYLLSLYCLTLILASLPNEITSCNAPNTRSICSFNLFSSNVGNI